MGDLINLKKHKKASEKSKRDVIANQNRLTFGVSKLEKQNSLRINSDNSRKLSAHKITESEEIKPKESI